jgi:S-DNA-T family DNA segregation ATPase FtsK/SpoIIIE
MLQAPPQIPPVESRSWGQFLQIIPMMAGTFAFALLFMMSSSRQGPLQWVIGAMFGLSALGMLGTTWGPGTGPKKGELVARRRDYMRYLASQRRQARRAAREQIRAAYFHHPDPTTLWSTVASARLWERRSSDADHGVIRVALGPQELATLLIPPASQPLEDLEPMCAAALQRFLSTYALVHDLPVAISLRAFSRVYATGEPDAVRAMIRAAVAQIVALHAPDDILIAVAAPARRRGDWEWVKWLPHALHPARRDALGRVRLIGHTLADVEALLADLIGSRSRFTPHDGPVPHIVVLLDGVELESGDVLLAEGGIAGLTVIDVCRPAPRVLDRYVLALEIDAAGQLQSATIDMQAALGRPDALGLPQAEALARQLAPLRLPSGGADSGDPLAGDVTLAGLLDIGDPGRFEPSYLWASRPARDRLRVPIGAGPDGVPVRLDLKESALDGMGPHGLVIGATGSGKSELLRTLVVALAVTHSPETLNFVLIDFKGGATFTTLDQLPHTSAVITNLVDELPLVDRMTDAINGELIRRQELLRRAGNFVNVHEYERSRAAGASLAPLPSLLIICDEFSELLTAKPDFIDMFVQIGRVGRSLGVHLLLASQRLEEGRLRGLDTHLSYRIGLRTFSAHESRVVLGVADAYELPRSPGHGYLKFGTEVMDRFRAAYASGPYRTPNQAEHHEGNDPVIAIEEFVPHFVAPAATDPEPDVPAVEEPAAAGAPTVLDVLVRQMTGRGVPAHQVWLPPLKEAPALDQILPPLAVDQVRGLSVAVPQLAGTLQVAIGLADRPLDQRRDVLWLDLAGANGHVALVGGPQTGKSTALRAFVCSLALCHTPAEVQCYVLDFGGGSFAGLLNLPHVGGVAHRQDTVQIRRAVAEVKTVLDERERTFVERGIDSIATYRRLRAAGELAEERFGDVFLIVDNWLTLRNEHDDLEEIVNDIANRGLSYGVHVVASASRWLDFRQAIRDLMGTRLELRLGDPSDSVINRKAAANVPEDSPGRGITPAGLHFISALPRLGSSTGDLGAGQAELVRHVRESYRGPEAPRVRLLPARVPFEHLPKLTVEQAGSALPIGIGESDLQPVYADFGAEPHMILFGDSESGKTTFLRVVARGIADRFQPEQARVFVVDYRRSLLGAVDPAFLMDYAATSAKAAGMMRGLATALARRLPDADATQDDLQAREPWSGARCFVLIDDYDLLSNSSENPIGPLLEFLPQARDIGLHLVVARRSGGAGRSMYEPVLQRLRELSSPGIVLSGDRDEGTLLGNVRPQRLPPGRGWMVTRRTGTQLIQIADLQA